MKDLTDKCRRSKFQVLFRPRFIDHLPKPILNCFFNEPGEEEADTKLHKLIGDKICSDSSAIKPRAGFADAVHRVATKTQGRPKLRRAERKGWKK